MLKLTLIAILPIFIQANFTPNFQLEFFNFSPFHELLKREYTSFTCWLACSERATVMCHYMGFKDTGNAARPNAFSFDPIVSSDCQQKSNASYQSIQPGYDR